MQNCGLSTDYLRGQRILGSQCVPRDYITGCNRLAENANQNEYIWEICKVYKIGIGVQDLIKYDETTENDKPPYFRVIQPDEIIQIIVMLHNPVNKNCVVCESGDDTKLSLTFKVLRDVFKRLTNDVTKRIAITDAVNVAVTYNPNHIFDVTKAQWTDYYNLNMETLLSDNTMKYLIICGTHPKESFRLYMTDPKLSATCTPNKDLYGHDLETRKEVEVEKCVFGASRREFFVTFTVHPSSAKYDKKPQNPIARKQMYFALINYCGQCNGITIAGSTGTSDSMPYMLYIPYGLALDNQLNLYVAEPPRAKVSAVLKIEQIPHEDDINVY
ncbi:unnamed protein product, partial [Didymodactylos carnosus]